MNVPSTDFMALMYIVPPHLHRCEPVSSLKRGADSLETAKFVDFWQVRETKSERRRECARQKRPVFWGEYCSAMAPADRKRAWYHEMCVILATF